MLNINMNQTISIFWLLNAIFCAVLSDDPRTAPKNHVTDLTTPGQFVQQVKSHDLTIIKFYTPWCGACQYMKEDYNNAAGILKNNKNVLFAEVNCDDAYIKQEICKHEDIKQYPTLKVFLNAKFLQLIHFSRTEEFVGYVRKFVKTDSVLLEDGNSEQLRTKKQVFPVKTSDL